MAELTALSPPLSTPPIPSRNVALPTVLVLSSGGVKGLGQLGALYCLEGEGMLDKIGTYVGCSVGSVISLLLCVGYAPLEILAIAMSTTLLKDWKTANRVDQALKDFGFVPYRTAIEPMVEMVKKKVPHYSSPTGLPTLKQLRELTGKDLFLVSSNLTDRKTEYISHLTYPDLDCGDAVAASMLVPCVLTKFEMGGKLFVDGALTDPFPVAFLDDGTHEVLGIVSLEDAIHPEKDILSYMYSGICIMIDTLQRIRTERCSARCKVITLHLPEINLLETNVDPNRRFLCFREGMLQCMKKVAEFHGTTYEQYFGSSVLPTTMTNVPCFQVTNKRDNLISRITNAFRRMRRGREES